MAGAGADLGPAGWALLPGLLGPTEVAALREESGSLLAAAGLGRGGGPFPRQRAACRQTSR